MMEWFKMYDAYMELIAKATRISARMKEIINSPHFIGEIPNEMLDLYNELDELRQMMFEWKDENLELDSGEDN